jgi:peptidoglycan/LPS O-acetylase OafA/YrhL
MTVRANNFDFIRWLAATMVVVSHQYAALGRPSDEPLARLSGFATFGTIGLDVFFVTSGYLIVRSLVRRGDLRHFVCSRALRIVPGLAVSLGITAFVIGALATTLPLRVYLRHEATWSYVTRGLGLRDVQWTLPGVFVALPMPVVNVSLWSLWPEVQMYLIVAMLGLIAMQLRTPSRPVLAGGMAAVAVMALACHEDLCGRAIEPTTLARLAPLFAAGALLGLVRWRAPTALIALALTSSAACVTRGTMLFVPLFDAALALAVIGFAHLPLAPLARWGRFGDWSYGMYVYAFPVQQLVASWAPQLGLGAHIGIVYPITVLLGATSWHVVEAPALAFKPVFAAGIASRDEANMITTRPSSPLDACS